MSKHVDNDVGTTTAVTGSSYCKTIMGRKPHGRVLTRLEYKIFKFSITPSVKRRRVGCLETYTIRSGRKYVEVQNYRCF